MQEMILLQILLIALPKFKLIKISIKYQNIYTCLVNHTVNSSTGMLCCILNGTLAILAARCVISIEPNILQFSCSTPQFFSEENSK